MADNTKRYTLAQINDTTRGLINAQIGEKVGMNPSDPPMYFGVNTFDDLKVVDTARLAREVKQKLGTEGAVTVRQSDTIDHFNALIGEQLKASGRLIEARNAVPGTISAEVGGANR